MFRFKKVDVKIRLLSIMIGLTLLLGTFNNCTSFSSSNSGSVAGKTTTTTLPPLVPTPTPPTPPPVNLYVETSITKALTCTTPFSGKLPSGWPAPAPASGAQPVVKYQWDFTNQVMRNEKTLYGYTPSFHPNRVGFAANGRPIIRDEHFNLQILNDSGTWESTDLLAVAKESMRRRGVTNWPMAAAGIITNFTSEYADPSISSESRVVFDSDCNAYAIINANRTLGYSILLHSYDGGHSWAAYPIPESDGSVTAVSMEMPSRKHVLDQTPILAIHQWYSYAGSPNTQKFVIPVKKTDMSLDLGSAVVVARNTRATGSVGGGETQFVSSGDSVFVVYPGTQLALDPITQRHGTPQYALTFSRQTRSVITGPTLLGVGVGSADESETDDHDQPVIGLDTQGYLHVVLGTHHGPLYYLKSSSPRQTVAWNPVEIIGQTHGVPGNATNYYTYPSLVLDQYDEPVVTARWASDGYTFKLVTTTKNVNTGQWNDQQVILDPGRPYYGHWYHKMAIDPWGRLFLSYRYYPDNLFADEAAIFAKTYGYTLSPYSGCVATNHDASVPSYCSYGTYDSVNSSVMVSAGLGRPFQLANTANFFF